MKFHQPLVHRRLLVWLVCCLSNVLFAAVPNAPTLIAPGGSSSPGTTITTLTPTMSWNSVGGATGYGLYVSDLTTGTLAYDNDSVANVTSLALPSGTLVAGRSYRWNMRARNSSGFSAFSGLLYFQTQSAVTVPNSPTLTSPGSTSSPGTTITTLTPTMSWSAVTGATGYGLYVSDLTTGSLAYDNDSVANATSLTLPSGTLVAGHSYRWNMRAKNSAGFSGFSGLLYFQTQQTTYAIATSSSPGAGGTVSGDGTFTAGSSRTVTATANSGYSFANWTESGSVVSSSASYNFTLNGNRTLVANFTVNQVISYTISLSASPSAGGTVSGNGTFASGSSRTVTATANSGYAFANWTENGAVVSSSASYPFTLNGNRNLMANFASSGGLKAGDRVKAVSDINVRTTPPELNAIGTFPQQHEGVHGTIVAGPSNGTAGGFTGNWWQIDWDAGTDGWCAQSVIAVAPSPGDVAQPVLSSRYYTTDNIFWKAGFAPASTSPPNPPGNKLGSALGNCTWYAHGRMRELGYNTAQLNVLLGDASEWDNAVTPASGITMNSTPTIHSIAQTDSGLSGSGHVAVVESVNSDGTITITESSYTSNSSSSWNFLWRHRSVSPTWFQTFITVSKADTSVSQTTRHPADTDTPYLILSFQEVFNFLVAWLQAPRLETFNDALQAAIIFLQGGGYSYDPNQGWVATGRPAGLQSLSSSRSLQSLDGGSASRQMPATYAPGAEFEVKVSITPPSGSALYVLEEQLPTGWAATVSLPGSFNPASGKVQFIGVGSTANTISYKVKPPAFASGSGSFTGKVTFGSGTASVSVNVGGQATITYDPPPTTTQGNQPPTVSITEPANGAVSNSSQIVVRGHASDDFQVAQVEVRVNNGDWRVSNGSELNGVFSWNLSVDLNPGQNTISARSKDRADQYSEPTTVTLTFNNNDTVSIVSPIFTDLYTIASGAGIFATSGSSDKVATSADGVTWAAAPTGMSFSHEIQAIGHADNLFVAVGNSGSSAFIMTSPNGVSWTSRFTSATVGGLKGVTRGGGLFVACGNGGKVLTSPDGFNWTARDTATRDDLYEVTYGNNLLVAVTAGGVVETSADAVNWTLRSTPGGTTALMGVTFGVNTFVAVGWGKILTSTDGINWFQRHSGEILPHVAFGNGYFVAVGENGRYVTSPDGQNWTSRASRTSSYLQGVAFGNNKFVAVGKSGTIVALGNSFPSLITSHPQSQTVPPGSSVTFRVEATGAASPTYQWLLNGSNLAGQTAATFSLANVGASNAGKYSVAVSSGTSIEISADAELTVSTPQPTVILNPANGHYYELVHHPERISWEQAKTEAASRSYQGLPGHLVTITSQAENEFVYDRFVKTTDANWLGAFQPAGSTEPSGGWQWITGEPFDYRNWGGGEPNNNGNENALQMPGGNGGTWNDGNSTSTSPGYVVEYEPPPPTMYTINTSGSPSAGGTTSGRGSKPGGSSVTVVATANPNYRFVNWTENGIVVSSSTSYEFTASADRNLVANFILTTPGTVVAWGRNDVGQATVPAGLSGVVAIASGNGHSLALKSDGTVVAWGTAINNDFGQANVPAGLSGVVAIAARGFNSLALKADGTVVAWGANHYGQRDVPAGLSGVVAIAAGNEFSLALKVDGTVVAWGRSLDGQVTVPVGLSGVAAIAGGGYHSLVLKAGGTVVAWGANGDGQAIVPADLSGVVAIAGGSWHNLALKADGTVVAWGRNAEGQSSVPAGLSGVVAIAAGVYHSLALKADGTVIAWGANDYGRASVPAGLSGVVAIAAGGEHNLALVTAVSPQKYTLTLNANPGGGIITANPSPGADGKYAGGTVVTLNANPIPGSTFSSWSGDPSGSSRQTTVTMNGHRIVTASFTRTPIQEGSVVAWGSNIYGQSSVPAGLSGVVAIAAGAYHGLALRADGTVVAWGLNEYGQTSVPAGLSGVIAIAAGTRFSLALRADGTVVAWGDNRFGQASVPAGLSGVVAIAGGGFHSLALKADGTVVGWGGVPTAGLGVPANLNVPAGLSGVVAIAGGYDFSLALKADGTVVAWGENSLGETSVPAGLSGVVAIARGHYHGLALKADGTIVAWGDNRYGQASVPGGLSGVVAIAGGFAHSLALIADGTVVAWDVNNNGQASVPAGLSGVAAIAAGWYHNLAIRVSTTADTTGPVANGEAVTLDEDTARAITLTGTSTAGRSLSYSIVATPTKGTLSGTAPNLTFTPNPDVNGADSFTFKVSNGSQDSSPATVNITINPVNDPPSVSLTLPSEGQTFTAPATIALTASANDIDSPISKVEFFEGSNKLGESSSAPYAFAWRDVPARNYSLTAKATDSQGAATTSAPIRITVNPGQPPLVVDITRPEAGAAFAAGATVVIEAQVRYNADNIAKVEFFESQTKLSEITSSGQYPNYGGLGYRRSETFTFRWPNVGGGNYSLTARATDNQGKSATSAPVSITVNTIVGAPTITTHPQSQTVAVGANVTFSVTASGTPPLSYVWSRNGSTIGSNPTLTILNAQPEEAGSYRVVISNAAGSAVSDAAILTVRTIVPPIVSISSPSSAQTFTAPATVSISATASDTDGNVAKVEFFQGQTKLGEATNTPFSYSWSNVPAGNYSLTARATDNQGTSATSSAVTITVTSGGDATAIQSAGAYGSSGTLTVSGQFNYPTGRQLLSLRWQPVLPSGWTLNGVSGDGSPEVQQGEIVFVGSLTVNPIKFAFIVAVPSGQTGTKEISGVTEYQWSGMVNPATVRATPNPLRVDTVLYHSADYREARWVIDGTEINRVLSYWRAGSYSLNAAGVDGYAAGGGDDSGRRHSADYRESYWRIDGTEINRVLSYWRAGGYRVDSQGADGFAAGASATPQSITANSGATAVRKQNTSPTISHQSAASYSAGSTLKVTNTFSYSGQLLSLLWRPKLPTAWALVSASATSGSVEAAFGEIVWVGTLPASPITMEYIVQVPAGQTGNKQIQGEVEYQLAGSVNAVTAFANPNPLTLAPVGITPPPTVTIAATDANASENGSNTGTFTVTRTGSTTSPLTVNYAISGTAGNASDYAILPASIVIPAGSISVTITLTPIDDALIDPNETVILTLSASAGYQIGAPNSATVTIADNDPVVVAPTPNPTITAIPDLKTIWNKDSDIITFTVDDGQTAPASLQVTGVSDNQSVISISGIQFAPVDSSQPKVRQLIIRPTPNQAGTANITLTVTDGDSLTASTKFLVRVLVPPTITAIGNQALPKNGSAGPIDFTISDVDNFPGFLTIGVESSNKTLVPNSNVKLAGSGANRSVTITAAPDQEGATSITITVTDPDGLSATNTFVVTVISTPLTITASAGANGAINPTGAIKKNKGEDQLFTATPAVGFVMDTWAVNGSVVQTSGNTYTIPNIQADTVVSVTFKAIPPQTRIIRLEGDLSFGDVSVRGTGQKALTIFNDGTVSLTVSSITYPSGFSGDWNGAIDPGKSQIVTITFTPTAAVTYTGNVEVNSNKTGGANTRAISGRGAGKTSFANSNRIVINDNTSAAPYPSMISMSGVSGPVSGITVTLANLSHTYTRDIGVLLVGPKGQKVVLMRKAGGKKAGATGVSNVTLTFTDAGSSALPSSTQISAGSYRPSDFSPGAVFPSPAPAGPYSTTLGDFTGVDPNGNWSLYIADTEAEDIGAVVGGWNLSFSTQTQTIINTPPTISKIENQTTLRDTPSALIVVSLSDKESAASSLTLSAVSSNKALAPDTSIFVSGNGADRTVVITPAAGQVGVTTITLTVADSGGLAASTGFTLTVTQRAESSARGDFDGDGRSDIVFQDNGGFLAAWFMDGANLRSAGYLEPSQIGDTAYHIVGSGDFDGDDREDLLFQHSDGTLAVWYMDRDRLRDAAVLDPSKPDHSGWRVSAVADFNGDGRPDLVLQDASGTIDVWIMNGIRRTERASLTPRGTGDGNWAVVGAGDFNSDGKPDLVFQHANGDLAVWHLDNFVARGVYLNPQNSGSPSWRVVSTADRNEDGQPDLLFQHNGDGSLLLWAMDGINRSSANSLNPAQPGGTWKAVAP